MSINMEEKNTEKEPLIRVENLKKYYPIRGGVITHTTGYVHSVDGVSFSIAEGETLGLVGESGCGKSTVGRQLVGLETPTGGRLFYQGKDMEKLSGKEKKSVRTQLQMVFQDSYSSLNPRKHIFEILAEPMLYHGLAKRGDVYSHVERLLDMVGLPKNCLGRYPHEFSGGQRQRIGIARALSLNPRLLVCDEPVSALDVSIQAQVLNLLMRLKEELKLTYIFITHNLSVVEYISDRIAVMYLGRIVELASTEQIFENTMHPYTEALLSAIPVVDPDNKRSRIVLEGDVPNPVHPPEGCHFHPRCKKCMDICMHKKPELKRHMINGEEHFCACHLYDQTPAGGSDD